MLTKEQTIERGNVLISVHKNIRCVQVIPQKISDMWRGPGVGREEFSVQMSHYRSSGAMIMTVAHRVNTGPSSSGLVRFSSSFASK